MKALVRRHLKLLDALSLAALVVGAVLCQFGWSLPGGLLMGAGLVCLFLFTLVSLSALVERCPCCGCPILRRSAGRLPSGRGPAGERRCPNCGAILP